MSRVVLAVAFGALFGWLTYAQLAPGQPTLQGNDFTYPWLAGKAILQGTDAYAYVGQSATPYVPVLFYPLTAGVAALPFIAFPAHLAAAVFVAIGIAFLSFALSPRDPWRLVILASAPVAHAVTSVQWSPILTAGAVLSPMLGLVAVKPNLALPLLAYQSSRRAVFYACLGGLVLLLASLALQPSWPIHWLAQFRSTAASQYKIPALTLLGWPLLAALARWRHPDGRLVAAMALVPQNGFFYDQLPLMLIARTRGEIVTLVVLSQAAGLLVAMRVPPGLPAAEFSARCFPFVLAGIYLPALLLVLLRRGNRPVPT